MIGTAARIARVASARPVRRSRKGRREPSSRVPLVRPLPVRSVVAVAVSAAAVAVAAASVVVAVAGVSAAAAVVAAASAGPRAPWWW